MIELEPLKKPYQFLNGSLAGKPPEELFAMGNGWNALLGRLGGEHTFHPPAEALALAMATGHAVAAQTFDGKEAGFAKLSPWMVDAGGHGKMVESADDFVLMGQGDYRPVCVEIGSLVVAETEQKNNLAKHLVAHAVEAANKSYPGKPKIAVVTNDNTASCHVFQKLGWSVLSREEAQAQLQFDVLDGWEPPSTIFIYNGSLE